MPSIKEVLELSADCIQKKRVMNQRRPSEQALPAMYTVPKAAHISEKYLGVYMGASPLAGKFPKAV
jgi:hypothetical protein